LGIIHIGTSLMIHAWNAKVAHFMVCPKIEKGGT
jgi:hypothetical protein